MADRRPHGYDGCVPGCRDRRPPAPGVARKVADALDRRRLTPAQMRVYLADLTVARFSDLCYSHADAIAAGLTKGILADEIARLDPDAPGHTYCPRCKGAQSDFDGLGPPCCDRCGWCPRNSLDGDGRCVGCGAPSTVTS